MGDPKLLTRFREWCETYKVEYAFEGIVEGFDTIDYVDPERLTRGLFVCSEEHTRFVLNEPKRKPPVRIGDKVVVVGRDEMHQENSVRPAVILNLTERYVLFSKDIQARITGRALLWYIPYFIGLGLVITVVWIVPVIGYSWLYDFGWLLVLCLFCVDTLSGGYKRRPRSYQCDEKTWHALTAEVAERFGITPSV